ncbi:MAG: hypothetical protein AAFV72_04975 [Cyanobacteria bacterium J06635_1]
MTKPLTVTIDLTEAGLELPPDGLEAMSLRLADELQAGGLAETAGLARAEDVPEQAKSAIAGFIWGVLTTEITRENLKKTLDFLGNQFYGKARMLEYKADGLECSIEYRNQADLDQAIAAVDSLEAIRIKIKDLK